MNKQNASASIPPDIAHDADITLEQPDISLRRWLLPLSERYWAWYSHLNGYHRRAN